MKKQIIHMGHVWEIDTTEHGVDLFRDGAYYTTLCEKDENATVKGISHWNRIGEQYILSLKE